MRSLILIISMSAFVAAASGCYLSGPTLEVIVTDPAGAPIAGASVHPVSPSFTGPPKLTDASGIAVVPLKAIQDVQWVSVKAPGFDSKEVPLLHDTSLRITLSPTPEEGRSLTAEETFKKIEETIEQTRTLMVMFRRERETVQSSGGHLGILLLSGKRAFCSKDMETSWVSDGKQVQCIRPTHYDQGILARERNREGAPASKMLGTNLKIMVSRAGLSMGLASIAFEARQDLDFSKELNVSGFRFGEKDGLASTLLYTLKAGGKGIPSEVTIWYDPKTLKLLKRKMSDRLEGGHRNASVEIYEEFRLDAIIPEEYFNLRDE